MKNWLHFAGIAAAVTMTTALAGCGGGGGSINNPPPTTYTLTVNTSNPTTGVTITVTPADNSGASSGTATFSRTYNAGTAVTLTAPATAGSNNFSAWTGCSSASTVTCHVTMNGNATVSAGYAAPKTTPTVTVTPSSSAITTAQSLSVAVTVSGGNGNPTPTGTVTLSSGSYTSAAATLASGSANITVPAGSLPLGSDTLTASYAPDSSSSAVYNAATGTSSAVDVTPVTSSISVDQASTGPAVTDQLLGMNLATWYDVVGNATPIVDAFRSAGIAAVRWPGGSWSDDFHWANNTECGQNWTIPNGFDNFVNDIVKPGGFDLALTANYGDDVTCTKPGDPAEAAAWIAQAVKDGIHVSHMTVGNEEYGSWETDHHALQHDPTTYAAAVSGTSGYYQLIKAADNSTLVGVDVEADNTAGGWDDTVLAKAKGSYDFVEYHFYPQGPGSESDTYLVHQAALDLTKNLNTLKSELANVGKSGTPIYVGEMGSVYSNPGKQSMSITQGLFAGQTLGEMMNAGVSRATWWIGFGNCNGTAGNLSSSLYGWQNFGAYNVFADGPTDTGCSGAGAIGSMSPTARAFQLFSKVAISGEKVLTANVTGDTTNVRAYAATNNGGTGLVLFNLSQSVSEPVVISLSVQTASSDVTVETYSKAIYDQSKTGVWASPTTTDLGAQNLPLTLTLDPWSMNVVILK